MPHSGECLEISGGIPQGIASLNESLCQAFLSSGLDIRRIEGLRSAISSSVEFHMPFFYIGGMVSSDRNIFEAGFEDLKLVGVLRQSVIDKFFVKERWTNLIGLISHESLDPTRFQAIEIAICNAGINRIVEPFLTTPPNMLKTTGAEMYFGSFTFNYPDQPVRYDASHVAGYMMWIGKRIHADITRAFPDIDRLQLRGFSKTSMPSKIANAILFDLCVENGSLDPSKIVSVKTN